MALEFKPPAGARSKFTPVEKTEGPPPPPVPSAEPSRPFVTDTVPVAGLDPEVPSAPGWHEHTPLNVPELHLHPGHLDFPWLGPMALHAFQEPKRGTAYDLSTVRNEFIARAAERTRESIRQGDQLNHQKYAEIAAEVKARLKTRLGAPSRILDMRGGGLTQHWSTDNPGVSIPKWTPNTRPPGMSQGYSAPPDADLPTRIAYRLFGHLEKHGPGLIEHFMNRPVGRGVSIGGVNIPDWDPYDTSQGALMNHARATWVEYRQGREDEEELRHPLPSVGALKDRSLREEPPKPTHPSPRDTTRTPIGTLGPMHLIRQEQEKPLLAAGRLVGHEDLDMDHIRTLVHRASPSFLKGDQTFRQSDGAVSSPEERAAQHLEARRVLVDTFRPFTRQGRKVVPKGVIPSDKSFLGYKGEGATQYGLPEDETGADFWGISNTTPRSVQEARGWYRTAYNLARSIAPESEHELWDKHGADIATHGAIPPDTSEGREAPAYPIIRDVMSGPKGTLHAPEIQGSVHDAYDQGDLEYPSGPGQALPGPTPESGGTPVRLMPAGLGSDTNPFAVEGTWRTSREAQRDLDLAQSDKAFTYAKSILPESISNGMYKHHIRMAKQHESGAYPQRGVLAGPAPGTIAHETARVPTKPVRARRVDDLLSMSSDDGKGFPPTMYELGDSLFGRVGEGKYIHPATAALTHLVDHVRRAHGDQALSPGVIHGLARWAAAIQPSAGPQSAPEAPGVLPSTVSQQFIDAAHDVSVHRVAEARVTDRIMTPDFLRGSGTRRLTSSTPDVREFEDNPMDTGGMSSVDSPDAKEDLRAAAHETDETPAPENKEPIVSVGGAGDGGVLESTPPARPAPSRTQLQALADKYTPKAR